MKSKIFLLCAIGFFGALPVSALAEEVQGTITTGLGSGVQGTVIMVPAASPVAGTYTGTQSVTLSAAGATSIRYTADGTTPTCASTQYASPISVASSKTIKAVSCYPNSVASTVASYAYTILAPAQTIPNGSGVAVADAATPQVVITNPAQAATITITSGTTNPTVDVSSFITGGTGTIPQITITAANAGNTSVAIPASTVVTSADATWNGIIAAPTNTTVTLPVTSGETKTLSTAIEVGFAGAKLSFSKAVRLLLPGQAGKRAGYIRTGIAFTEITTVCSADNQATGDALPPDGECKIDVGSDLAIWTKHFTQFATYTQTATVVSVTTVSSSSSGGSSGGGTASVTTAVAAQKADANKDGKIDVLDFVSLMANWGKSGANIATDFNGDGRVDVLDFVGLMANWTK